MLLAILLAGALPIDNQKNFVNPFPHVFQDSLAAIRARVKTSCLDILSFFLVTPRTCNSDGVFDGARQFENVFDGVHFLHFSRAFYSVIFCFSF